MRQRGRAFELIDVRAPVEYREVHAEAAWSVPLDRLDPRAVMDVRNGTSEGPLHTICRSGSRGRQAREAFHAAEVAHVNNVEGGTLAREQAGLPVARGAKSMSLERQVRIGLPGLDRLVVPEARGLHGRGRSARRHGRLEVRRIPGGGGLSVK